MKINLTYEQINAVVKRSCSPMSDEGLRLNSFLSECVRGEEDDPDPEMEAELGFSTVDTVEKCIAWLEY
jgi:hypothetical protein